MATTTKVPNYISLGSGILQFQTYTATEADQFMKLIDFGAQRDTKIVTERTKATFEEGTPKQIVVEDITSEKVTIECTFSEMSPDEIIARLGVGSKTNVVADASHSETEYKTLTGTAWEMLRGKDGASFVVTSQDATPVTYTVDVDYEMGTKEGSDAIRRISGGAIEDGEQIKIVYTWDKPELDYIKFGGSNSTTYYHMRHVNKLRDACRIIHEFWKVGVGGKNEFNFQTDNYGSTTCTFTCLADTSQTEGDQYYRVYYEQT